MAKSLHERVQSVPDDGRELADHIAGLQAEADQRRRQALADEERAGYAKMRDLQMAAARREVELLRGDARRRFVEGGGDPADFDRLWGGELRDQMAADVVEKRLGPEGAAEKTAAIRDKERAFVRWQI